MVLSTTIDVVVHINFQFFSIWGDNYQEEILLGHMETIAIF